MGASVEFEITTHDGLTLLGRRWRAASAPPRARALIVHGVGEHSGRYDEVADAMTKLGVEVVSYDQRGFGASEGTPGVIPEADALVADAAMIFRLIEREGGDDPPFLVAHSMGAAIAAFAVTHGHISPRGLVLSSPAIAPRMAPLVEPTLRLLVWVTPALRLDSRIRAEDVTRDTNEQQKIKNDKRMHTTVTPRLVVSIVDQGQAALKAADRILVPTLLLVAGTDRIVDQDVTLRFFARIPARFATLHQYPELFHEVFNEVPSARQQVFADFDRWLRGQLGLLPPGAGSPAGGA